MKGLYAVFFILSLVSIIIFPLSLQFVFAQKKNEANTFPVIANIGLETIEKGFHSCGSIYQWTTFYGRYPTIRN